MKYIQLAPKQLQKSLCDCKCVWAQVLEDCAEPERLSSPQGKRGNTEVGEHQDRWMSLLTVKSRSVRLMQLLHSPEQFLKVITALSSMSFLPHQHPSSRHGIYRAVGWGINPSLMATNAGGGVLERGNKSESTESERSCQDSSVVPGLWNQTLGKSWGEQSVFSHPQPELLIP